MKITISEKQLKLIIGNTIDMAEQEETTTGYPTVNKWESGATRGPANQIGNTKWSDIVGSTLVRSKANQLMEQGSFDINFNRRYGTAASSEKSNKENRELVNSILNIDPHTRNMVLGIAAAFIPLVGPFISAGIGLYDAKQYYDEGDTKTAGMVAMFSVIPGINAIKTAIPLVKKLGTKGMTLLGTKLSKGVKIVNPEEIEIVNSIRKYRPLIQQELNKKANELSIMAAKSNLKKQIIKQNITKGATKLGKSVAKQGTAAVGYDYGFDYVTRKQEEANLKILNKKLGLTN
jgi:hypothetical protein